jgi:putative ABC transport system permease protein
MTALLHRASRRYLQRHPWQLGLSVLGVALGVAVVISIDLANQSALRSFELSMSAVVGRATHQIVGGPSGLPEETYRRLLQEGGVWPAAPVVEAWVGLPEPSPGTLHVLGVDPFAEEPFRSYLPAAPGILPDLTPLLTRTGTCMLTRQTARRLGIRPGQTFTVTIGPRSRSLELAGLLEPEDELGRQALADLVLTDISTAQELLEQVGRLSWIDLILPEEKTAESVRRLQTLLPPGAQVVTVTSRTRTGREMTRAFTLNLTALSLLALVCGIFLNYNTMSFAVVQRRTLLGSLWALGATRRELLAMILVEGTAIGLLGTALGLGMGILLAERLLLLVTRTLNDLYFEVTVRQLAVSWWSVGKAIVLGAGGSLLASLHPALEATEISPRLALTRSALETRRRQSVARNLAPGGVLLALSLGLLLAQGPLAVNLAGVFTLLIGSALLTPAVTVGFMKLLRPGAGRLFGLIGKMATTGVVSTLSRTAVAVAALMIAVSVSVGLGLMIGSFRYTVKRWLETSLQADAYISAPRSGISLASSVLEAELARRVAAVPGVVRVNTLRTVAVDTASGRIQLVALDLDSRSYDAFQLKEGSSRTLWPAFQEGRGVLISEPFAYRQHLQVGSTVVLPTPRGERNFPVVGVYYDYGSDQGVVMMSLRTYRHLWGDPRISALGVFAAHGIDPQRLVADLRAALGSDQRLVIRSNRVLKDASLQVFDRTFLVTDVLRILAGLVAFVGIVSALVALQLERVPEIGLLRAQGLTPGQVWGLVTSQTGLMGLTAGLLSLPLGTALAWIMVYIINRRAFGWTLQLQIAPLVLLEALGMALVAALLAGAYPAYRMARISPAVALREE